MGRPIVLSWVRQRKLVLKPRHYAKVENCLAQVMKQSFWLADPGDVFEVAHAEFGFQIATVKVGVNQFQIMVSEDITSQQEAA